MGEGTVEELDNMVEVAPALAARLWRMARTSWLALMLSRVSGGRRSSMCPWPANPKDPYTERAVILTVYREGVRKRGIARLIMLQSWHGSKRGRLPRRKFACQRRGAEAVV